VGKKTSVVHGAGEKRFEDTLVRKRKEILANQKNKKKNPPATDVDERK